MEVLNELEGIYSASIPKVLIKRAHPSEHPNERIYIYIYIMRFARDSGVNKWLEVKQSLKDDKMKNSQGQNKRRHQICTSTEDSTKN